MSQSRPDRMLGSNNSAVAVIKHDAFEPSLDTLAQGWAEGEGILDATDDIGNDINEYCATAIQSLRDTPPAYQPDAEPASQYLFAVHYREFRSGDAALEWTEPAPCECRYPHSYNPKCHACMLEFFAKGRRSWDPQSERFIWDTSGEYGAHHQSREISNFRAHVTKLPNDQWILIMSEFSHIEAFTMKKRIPVAGRPGRYHLKEEPAKKTCRNVLGFKEVFDLEEGEHQANEMVEHWIWAREHAEGDIVETFGHGDYFDVADEMPPMGAAVVSPEYLEHMIEAQNGEVIA